MGADDRSESVVDTINSRPRRSVLKLLGTGIALPFASGAAAAHTRETSAPQEIYDFDEPNEPENLAIDDEGNKYVTMSQTEGSEVRVLPANETLADFTIGAGFLTGIVVDDDEEVLYVAVSSNNAPGTDTHGIHRVYKDGRTELVAPFPTQTIPNGVFMQGGRLLVSDSSGGAIYTVELPDGDRQVWIEDPALSPLAEGALGANGLALREDTLYVDNKAKGLVAEVPIQSDGSAGELSIFVDDQALDGADGMTFDRQGHLYVAVNEQDKIAHITPDATITTIAEGDDGDGLDFPSDVAFGTTGTERTELFITNFACLDCGTVNTRQDPGLLKIDIGISGDVE